MKNTILILFAILFGLCNADAKPNLWFQLSVATQNAAFEMSNMEKLGFLPELHEERSDLTLISKVLNQMIEEELLLPHKVSVPSEKLMDLSIGKFIDRLSGEYGRYNAFAMLDLYFTNLVIDLEVSDYTSLNLRLPESELNEFLSLIGAEKR